MMLTATEALVLFMVIAGLVILASGYVMCWLDLRKGKGQQ